MKIGLIRCRQSEEECGGIHCFKCIENKEGALADIEGNLELVGVATCGGCPGGKIKKRVEMMDEAGADAVVFGSCIKLGTPIDFSCPHLEKLKREAKEAADIEIISWTHHSTFREILVDRIKNAGLSDLDKFFNKGLNL